MLSKQALEFILQVTHYFNGHWEDPDWGKSPASQVVVALALRDLAEGVHDSALRSEIRTATDKIIAKSAGAMAR